MPRTAARNVQQITPDAAKLTRRTMATPFGPLQLFATADALAALALPDRPGPDAVDGRSAVLTETQRQLEQYFAGKRRVFELPLALDGTEFQQTVWRALADIPYGETCTYSDVARRVGRPAAVRAVGAANGANPIAIILPCHRVIGANGTLTGYGGGLDLKRKLLAHEQGAGPLFMR